MLFLAFNLNAFSSVIYVDNFNSVYQFVNGNSHSFDINNDGEDDISLVFYSQSLNISCGNTQCSNPVYAYFEGLNSINGQNYLNVSGIGSGLVAATEDCQNDTVGVNSLMGTLANIYWGCPTEHCVTIGIGMHSQGFKVIVPNGNGGFGYLYGYFNYTLTNTGDIIIHGWYYEDVLNTEIIANSSATSIQENTNSINLYPNPTNNLITLDIEGFNGSVNVEVYDLQGRLLETTTNTTISMGEYAKGIYVFKVAYGDRTQELKVVKE
jgi:hypothetical protein